MASKERKPPTPTGRSAAPRAKPAAKAPAKSVNAAPRARSGSTRSAAAKAAAPAPKAATPESAPVPASVPPLAKIEPVAPAPAAVKATVEPDVAKPAEPAGTQDPIKTAEPAAPVVVAKTPVAAIQKELKTMEATIKSATEKTQTLFAEANERAKAAVEKSTKLFEEANEFSKGNLEAIVESGKIAAKGIETLGQDAADYGRKQLEGATAAMKNLASVKSPTDFFKLHSDYVRSTFDSIVAQTSKNTEAMLKLAGEVAQPISNRVAIAAEKVKIAA